MRRIRYAMVALVGALVLVSGCKQDKVAEKPHPATVEQTDQEGILRITLEAQAAERIGLETATVDEARVDGAMRKVVPYGALMYDTHGDTWTYVSPEPLVFMRHAVVVDRIDGERVILEDGPPAGTAIVTVGAAELLGVEHGL